MRAALAYGAAGLLVVWFSALLVWIGLAALFGF